MWKEKRKETVNLWNKNKFNTFLQRKNFKSPSAKNVFFIVGITRHYQSDKFKMLDYFPRFLKFNIAPVSYTFSIAEIKIPKVVENWLNHSLERKVHSDIIVTFINFMLMKLP